MFTELSGARDSSFSSFPCIANIPEKIYRVGMLSDAVRCCQLLSDAVSGGSDPT